MGAPCNVTAAVSFLYPPLSPKVVLFLPYPLTEVSVNLFAHYSACPVEIGELAGDDLIQVTEVLSLHPQALCRNYMWNLGCAPAAGGDTS